MGRLFPGAWTSRGATYFFENVWQLKDLWARFPDVWQIKDLQEVIARRWRWERTTGNLQLDGTKVLSVSPSCCDACSERAFFLEYADVWQTKNLARGGFGIEEGRERPGGTKKERRPSNTRHDTIYIIGSQGKSRVPFWEKCDMNRKSPTKGSDNESRL